MNYTVTVNEDDISEIVRLSLEEVLSINLLSGDDTEYTTALVAAMVIVHEYYSTASQHEDLLAEYDEEFSRYNTYVKDLFSDKPVTSQEDSVSNISVINEEDGSATISFDADLSTINMLAAKGAEYCILQSLLDGASTSDILRWAERGRQEEKTDDIMRRFNEAKAQGESDGQ